MSELVWIHRLNTNELGLGNRGSFCLVPVAARVIFFPNRDFVENPTIDEKVTVSFQNVSCEVRYTKPESKTEHRLSLVAFSEYIGDEKSGKSIKPNDIGCFFRDNDTLYFTVAEDDSAYGHLLKTFPSRGLENNVVTEVVFKSKSEASSDNKIDLPKPFMLLAGVSGTGKTRFVRDQALSHDFEGGRNYCIVPVRPDWHEPSDLLGYVSHISGTPKYISTKVLDFIIDAWRVCAPNASKDGMGELDLNVPPFWLCLDEMNLAPVEQYFADYLSVLETREYKDGKYSCDTILDKSVLGKNSGSMKQGLKLDGSDNKGLWGYFSNNGISLPPNLIVAGTVNMDETTHGFSRKVIDRAFSIDFGEFFPNDFESFFEPTIKEKIFSFSTLVQAKTHHLTDSFDPDGTLSRSFLNDVNEILRHSPFEIAYRALNELFLYVACFKPQDEKSLQAVWDDFLMTKILPRIDGDEDKLRFVDDGETTNILKKLENILGDSLNLIWEDGRLDFFRENIDGSSIENIACRSRHKINWMKDRLETNTFTSFWP